ncbi:MAG: hypothetical protein FJ217_14085 [Ignavibacteria bacterium]|nr:hypothetical protein [Ignavibacteria bacterium]
MFSRLALTVISLIGFGRYSTPKGWLIRIACGVMRNRTCGPRRMGAHFASSKFNSLIRDTRKFPAASAILGSMPRAYDLAKRSERRLTVLLATQKSGRCTSRACTGG